MDDFDEAATALAAQQTIGLFIDFKVGEICSAANDAYGAFIDLRIVDIGD